MFTTPRFWYQEFSITAQVLRPLAWAYRLITALRVALYKHEVFKSYRAPMPVIIVGNITAGGTGKTPLVIALVKALQQWGYQPAVISRGYGAKAKQYPKLVKPTDTPDEVGDEPLLIAQSVTCPVVIDPKRVNAVKYLVEHTQCNIIISDDGLQHYALQRDLEIAVIDGTRRLGNCLRIPAGPLRESPQRLQQVDFVINNGASNTNEISMQLAPGDLVNVADPEQRMSPERLQNQEFIAMAGIGAPARFFNTLEQLGLKFIKHPLPDHYNYQAADLKFAGNLPIVMTQKDAVKCQAFAATNHWYLPIKAVLADEFYAALKLKLQQLQVS